MLKKTISQEDNTFGEEFAADDTNVESSVRRLLLGRILYPSSFQLFAAPAFQPSFVAFVS